VLVLPLKVVERVESDLRPVDDPDGNDEFAARSNAIAPPARMQILRIVERQTPCTCRQLLDELELAQSTVSQHLTVMKAAGVLAAGPSGDRYLEPAAMRRLRMMIGAP
jgi:ArsR family transcriptional regulator, arsenate/arsenite/antimonite-responsive transcriptional repressor